MNISPKLTLFPAATAFFLSSSFPADSATTAHGGWIGNWAPGIGDPTFIGWLTVVAYLAAAVLCFNSARTVVGKGERVLWSLFTAMLFFLGVNKQLDLQTGFTEAMRQIARAQGWYDSRVFWQWAFILGLAAAGVLVLALAFWVTKKHSLYVKVALLGLCLIVAFVLVRASSFHHVDRLLSSRLFNFKLNWILELGGISVVAAGAVGRFREVRIETNRE